MEFAPDHHYEHEFKDRIVIRGAREHNLKNINLEIPRDKLTVITGLSGSGKSSLAFDTIYAEGQRRYIETMSAYARQFLNMMEKPDVEFIDGLSPAISIEQKTASRNPRSTVGTVTEIYDYLRLLYAKIGVPYCYQCGRRVENFRCAHDDLVAFDDRAGPVPGDLVVAHCESLQWPALGNEAIGRVVTIADADAVPLDAHRGVDRS